MNIGIPSGNWNADTNTWEPSGGGNSSGAALPHVSDPDLVFAHMTKQDYLDYIKTWI